MLRLCLLRRCWLPVCLLIACKPPAPSKPARPAPVERADGDQLPEYSLMVAGGRMDPKPAPAGFPYAVLIEPPARVELVLRPASPVKRRPYAKIFWVREDQVRRWEVGWTSEPGHASIRFRGDGQRPLGAGSGELIAVVSHVDDIPDDPEAVWLRAPPRHWRVKPYPVRWP